MNEGGRSQVVPVGTQGSARPRRVPLCVRAFSTGLRECWSLNISQGGLAVVGAARSPGAIPTEGSILELAFALPDVGQVRVRARVQWLDRPTAGKGGEFAVGVAFTEIGIDDRASVARYIAGYRPGVVLAFASAEEEARAHAALGASANVSSVSSLGTLRELLEHGEVAAVVLFGDNAQERNDALELIDVPRSRLARFERQQPRTVFCGSAATEDLLELLNTNRLFQSLPPSIEPLALARAVHRAVEDFAMRAEHSRVSAELERALARERSHTLPTELPLVAGARDPLVVFRSSAMREVMRLVDTVASREVLVLVHGETGTGKELLARAIHDRSGRARGPLVVQDCGALTETLLESELFGHVKGAFTGALGDRPGLFEVADGGTLFLDEIENTTPSLQAKLLRVLETGQVRPVGGSTHKQVDVRVVAASNRDLRSLVATGQFRADLYYRLNGFPIDIAPLRERPDDILPLATHLIARANVSLNTGAAEALAPDVQKALVAYGWPGNVREMKNALERALLLTERGEPIRVQSLPREVQTAVRLDLGRVGTLKHALAGLERDMVAGALAQHGTLALAAHALGENPVTLGRRARKLGLWPIPSLQKSAAGLKPKTRNR